MGDSDHWQESGLDIPELRKFITHNSGQAEYFFQEGCFITELLNSPDEPERSIAKARVEPGQTTRWHQLEGIIERYLIVEGRGVVEVGDETPREVMADDVVTIPAGVRQRITNSGKGDLIFLAICSPRFVAEGYVDVEVDLE